MTMNESKSAQESSLELKYCERCGALWLRPTGGGQVYCVSCAIALGEMPAAGQLDRGRKPQMPRGPRWAVSFKDRESYETYSDIDLDGAGGGA